MLNIKQKHIVQHMNCIVFPFQNARRGGHFARPAFFVSCATTKGRDSRRSQRGYSLCSRRGQFPLRGKGKESLAQSPLPLRSPPETWGTPPYTVTTIRFPALMGRQSCHFLESTSLYPPPAALWCFPLWKFLPRKDGGATVEREAEDVLFATPVCEGLSGAGTH